MEPAPVHPAGLMACFDEIHVINLPHRQDRRDEVQAQLLRLGCPLGSPGVHLFPAVRPQDAGPFDSIGARGCFMSHLGVLERAVERGLSSVLLLEDDCDFTADAVDRVAALAASELGGRWYMLYGGTLTAQALQPAAEGWRRLPPQEHLIGAHCIGLRGPAIAEMADYLRRMLARPGGDPDGGPMHVDGAYSWFRQHHPERMALLASPPIAHQRASRTDIHALRWFDRLPGLRSGVAVARQLKNAWVRQRR